MSILLQGSCSTGNSFSFSLLLNYMHMCDGLSPELKHMGLPLTICTSLLTISVSLSLTPFFSLFLTLSYMSTQVLSPELEHGDPSHRLCLHYRDFPHNAYVADSIVSAVTSSRRTILVLSKNFLVHEWSRFEVKSALHDVLKSGGQRTIILLVGEVSPRDLDPDLLLAVKANPTIHWSDRMFWEKLR